MQYFQRNLMIEIIKWLDRKEILAIRGPRQSGKTTLLKMISAFLTDTKKIDPTKLIFITFEDREILDVFSKDAKEYIKSFIGKDKENKFFFLIDEFQYLAEGGQKLKLLYDLFDNVKFIISGSSSLELTSHTSKYLVGRVFLFDLFQFNLSELFETKETNIYNAYLEQAKQVKDFVHEGKEFITPSELFENELVKYFEEYLKYGGYPEVIKTNDPAAKHLVLKNIYETYITRDIIELLRIEDVTKYRTVIALLANNIGNLINYNSLALDGQSHFKQIKHHLSVLEETFIIRILSPYFSNMTTELKKNPKIYFVDLGLRNYIVKNFNELNLRSDAGKLVENVVLSQIWKKSDTLVKYWRTTGKAEVDFIIDNGQQIIPVEVKYSKLKAPEVSRGFRSYLYQYQPERAVILTKGFWGSIKIGKTKIRFIPVWYI